jgi:hypothetical protein
MCGSSAAPEQASLAIADARLARQQHHLPLAILGLLEAVEQHAQLVLAANQRCQTSRAAGSEPALGLAFAPHPPGLDLLAETLELGAPEIGQIEQPGQAMGSGPITTRWSGEGLRRAKSWVSPTTVVPALRLADRSPTTTSPVSMPTRTANAVPSSAISRLTALRSLIPARTARSASSSCARG